ncbi:type II toxin-antitoxin system Phd/YefM family antitoxin [Streptomyces sp. NPDC090073]|uniref:type II toxin-antitoxin system Phd/YefM family antitoxin n=1 Tax=Streptomyces sp. NPDC090073 TaxID=3365936 RepID=UPI00380C6EA4
MKKYTEVPSTQIQQAPGPILDRVFRGETIMLTRYGRPYVLLSPPPTETPAGESQASGG